MEFLHCMEKGAGSLCDGLTSFSVKALDLLPFRHISAINSE